MNTNLSGVSVFTIVGVVLAGLSWLAFWLNVYNATRINPWYRYLGSIVICGGFGLYWLAYSVARIGYNYVGPSATFTLAGIIVQGVAIFYLFGLAIMQGKSR